MDDRDPLYEIFEKRQDLDWYKIQKILVEIALVRFQGNKSHAASALGMSRRTIMHRCHNLNIEVPYVRATRRKAKD